MDLKKMYLQSLENAFELAKVAKTKDDVSLAKADVYARIATAIATAMIDVEDKETTEEVVTTPVQKEEKQPVQVVEEPITEPSPDLIRLAEAIKPPLPPEQIDDEDEEARKIRYEYLLSQYKDTVMKDLPEEVFDYLVPEANVNAAFEWLWDEAFKDNSEKRKESIVKEFTGGKLSSMADITLSLYLEKVIPCEQDWIYFMMFEDSAMINDVLAKCTTNRYKDFRDLSNFAVSVWHTATQQYMNDNFEAIEKVS